MQEDIWEDLILKDFPNNIKKYKEKIGSEPKNAINYYYLAKEYMLKVPIRVIPSLKEIENLLKKSLELDNKLWAPKIFLGELLFKQGKYLEAEKYFDKIIKEKPESVSIKEFLAKCIKHRGESLSEKELLYLFENDLRVFIKEKLENKFEGNWWREGIPTKTRSNCASRREEGLNEEKDLDLLLFANFYDYKEIIKQNKNLFGQIFDVKYWADKINSLEPIRNVIAHNRDLDKAFDEIKKCYDDFQKVVEL